MTGTQNTNRRSGLPTPAALLFLGHVLLREERTMAGKLPKDNRRLTQLTCRHGGYTRTKDGEIVVGHPDCWEICTQVKSRRKDSSMELHQLAKAVLALPSSKEKT
jgi:hypothetical protein